MEWQWGEEDLALLGFQSINVQPLHLHGFAGIAVPGYCSALVKTGHFVKAFCSCVPL